MTTKYPIYVISKGRHDCCLTADFLLKDGVDFHIVIEPQELELYLQKYPRELIYVLPFSNLGQGSIPARNWCWEHAKEQGHKRHWIIDDNIRQIRRLYKGKRIVCNSKIAFDVVEEFVDRYENIAVSGLNYTFFVMPTLKHPFFLNTHVYSCLLIDNNIPQRWRGRYNEDTDLCLQVLSAGYCTVAFNTFMTDKMATMTMKGGNATELYKGDGRLKMSRSLERVWPGVVETDRRFGRPQHKVKNEWQKFDNELIRRTDIDWNEIENKKWDIKLTAVDEIKSNRLKNLLDDTN